jgi:hypothetical protein
VQPRKPLKLVVVELMDYPDALTRPRLGRPRLCTVLKLLLVQGGSHHLPCGCLWALCRTLTPRLLPLPATPSPLALRLSQTGQQAWWLL